MTSIAAAIIAALRIAREAADVAATLRAVAGDGLTQDDIARINAEAARSDDDFDRRVADARRRLEDDA